MLCELAIKNFAIIDDLRISFSGGLTILSGETGAGKSIIVNAVNLILGSRAAVSLIRSGSEEAELEAYFVIMPGSKTDAVMKEKGFDSTDGLLIRRIISNSGRHKIYINGRLTTIQMLSGITDSLASISGQHAHQRLLKEDLHLRVLDQFHGLIPEREKVYRNFHQLIQLIEELDHLNHLKNSQDREEELLRFQQKEIADADVKTGEDKDLEVERSRLKNAQWLLQTIHDSVNSLYDAQGSVIERLSSVGRLLEKASAVDQNLASLKDGIEETLYQIEDITTDLRDYLKNIRVDPKELERIESRLDLLAKLKRKYGGSIDDVLQRFDIIESDLEAIENLSDKIESVKNNLSRLKEQLFKEARTLSEKRQKAAEILGGKVAAELRQLNMPDAEFIVAMQSIPETQNASPYLVEDGVTISESGIDQAQFMIAPNIGEPLKPLMGIASGGELSRVVLALNAISAETDSLGTVVFDEVDAGIGGATAEVVGKKLSELGRYHQVLCITHLPQIAKFADHHFRISKQVAGGRTLTLIDPIDKDERVREIARMMGGESITEKTLEHAREMLVKKE